MTTLQILLSENRIIPFIENIESYYYEYENEESYLEKKTTFLIKSEDGIIINCLPSINNFIFPHSNFFQNKLTFLEKNRKGYIQNKIQNDISANQLKQVYQQRISESIYIDNNLIDTNIIQQLSNTNVKNNSSFITLDSTFLKNDIMFNKKRGINNLFNDSISNINYPDPIPLLNNEIEKQLIQFDTELLNYYIYHINYPINHSNLISFTDGFNIEPFSISNTIQFKNKQENEFNRFYSDIDQSKNSRNEEVVFVEKYNQLDKDIYQSSFFDNINNNNEFLIKSSYEEVDSYIIKVLEDNQTGNIFDSFGRLTTNYKLKIKDNNKKRIYTKNFITTDSYIFSNNNSNNVKPFNDNDKNIIYSNENYNDSTFKEIYKNNELIEKIQNSSTNIYYEKNDKFTTCGFDWSYTNSIGKNSIAFKGLE